MLYFTIIFPMESNLNPDLMTLEKGIHNQHSTETNSNVDLFMNTLNAKQKKGLQVAAQQLGSSFSLEKCSLYLTWKHKNK